MSAPLPDDVALGASTTSSGFSDGLGRRVLSFDREEGTMLEGLVVRPELGAFEKALRDRIERVASIEDERLVRPRSIQRDGFGSLVVISEFVPGSRLAELLDTSQDLGIVPGVDAGLGYLLDVLPALCGLHAGARLAHGTIAPTRTVLTPAGQVVLLDIIYGEPLAALRYGRRKLWTDFDIATPPTAGIPRLDFEADISQAATCALTIALGRRLRDDEYPMAVPGLVRELANAARIRRNASFAEGLLDFLHRALPLPGTRPYATADDALFDVRELANDLGVAVCRRAIAEFVEQIESPGTPKREASVAVPTVVESGPLDDAVALFEPKSLEQAEKDEEDDEQLDAGGAEIDLDALVDEPLYDLNLNAVAEIDLSSEQVSLDDPILLSWPEESGLDARIAAPPREQPPHLDEFPTEAEHAFAAPPAGADESLIFPSESVEAHADPSPPVSAAPPEQVPVTSATPEAATAEPEQKPEPDEAPGSPSVRQRRAKRHQRSARARKDKLRSAAASVPATLSSADPIAAVNDEVDELPTPAPEPVPEPQPMSPAVVSAPPKPSWLVPPERAAAFEPPVADPPAPLVQVPPPVPAYTPPVAAFPSARPTPAAPLYPPIPMAIPAPPRFEPTGRSASVPPSSVPAGAAIPAPPAWVPPTPLARANVTPNHAGASPQLASVKLKEPEKRPRGTRAPAPEITVTLGQSAGHEAPRAFPWKLAVAAVVLIAAGIAAARTYMPKGSPAPSTATATALAAATPRADSKPAATPPKNSALGRLEIETQPAGARILLDGKPAGESPLVLDDVAPGRHTITFVSSSGSVKRTVRVEAGRTAKVDVPIFSGWVGIFAPFILQVSEDGRSIGTTEEPRLMLSPGKHVLTLTNKELEYSSVQTVDIEPGEVSPLTIDPRGPVNFNATPWAEVWVDGKKLGETPLANQQMPLGVREVVFKHPQFGERRVTVTVKGKTPAAVSVDFK